MKYHDHVNDTRQALDFLDYEPIMGVVSILKNAKEKGNTVFTFGNGGSHCNASHFAQDLLKSCGIKAICISDLSPSILAYMNDEGPGRTFEGAFEKLCSKGDILVGFSCSGNSPNVTNLLLNGKYQKILFTGDNESSRGYKLANIAIKVPNSNIRIQESCHSVICHAIIEALLDE